MNIAFWIVQIVLALLFLMAGATKVVQPMKTLAERMEWVKDFTPSIVRLIGILEVLGALGLILPAATHILPWLTPVAATCLALTMVGAILVHARRGETSHLWINVVLLVLAIVVVYGRFVLVPIS